MRKEGYIPGRFQQLYHRLRSYEIPYKIIFFIIGIASTVWFLIRVIPKPSRAGYPCMRAAAPFMSSFIMYLLSISGSALLFKRSRQFFYRTRYIMAGFTFLGALVIFALSSNLFSPETQAAPATTHEDYVGNQPMGDGMGVFPGRVVWAWDPDATDENCTNVMDDPVRGEDGYFLAKNNDQEVINGMMKEVVLKLTGTYTVKTAWDSLFVDFNRRKGLGAVTYQPDQKIFIKINQGGGGWLTESDDLSFKIAAWTGQYYGMAETSPAMVITVLDQLVNSCGIAEEDIYVGDPIAHIYKHNYDQMVALFPGVKYVDKDHADLGRTKLNESANYAIQWSDQGDQMPTAGIDALYEEMENADYMINIAALKAHARAGITLTTKNHFGSHTRGSAEHLHPGLIAPENDVPIRTDYGIYRVLTDVMGHEKLGGNTVLFVVDGLWGGTEAVEKPVKWNSAPFNGDWPNSIIASQDQVALESVCFDFLRNEFTNPAGPGKARPLMGGVDDHLHQAADSQNWPDGFTYDPEGDGTPIGSLGVHEHWNSVVDKQYSRNLGYTYGIELISADKSLVQNTIAALEAEAVPVVDGEATDACWSAAQWHHIDETWITWGESIDSSDYFGRFKVCWSEAENLVYFCVEITDETFVDGYVFPNSGYPDFDIVEVFLDEDRSGGLHVFDDNPTWGENSENAFSYHIAVNAPEEGATESAFYACDLDGTDWGDNVIDYAGHIPELAMKKSGNLYTYEFSLKVYDDSYDHADPEASRVTLEGGKVMGLSLAYCDNDTPGTERDNFFGSVWVPVEEYNDHWKNADGFGSVRLVKTGESVNHAVEVSGTIADFEVTETGVDLVVHDNLLNVFNDPDGDPLSYTVNCDNTHLTFTVTDHVLKVNATEAFEGEADVTVVASDGEFEASTGFKVTRDVTGIPVHNQETRRVRCYPNPFTDLVHLEVNLESVHDGPVAIRVYNMAGMLIYTHPAETLSGGHAVITLELEGEPKGIYILEMEAGGDTHSILLNKH